MKHIMQEYGRTWLTVLLATILLAFSLNIFRSTDAGRELANSVLSVLEGTNQGEQLSAQRELLAAQISRACPVIQCSAEGIRAGENIDWSKIFTAKDAEACEIEVCIESINGEMPAEEYAFPRSGIYELEVSATDHTGKRSCERYLLPVARAKKAGEL